MHFMKTKTRARRHRKTAATSPRQRRNRWIVWITVALMLAAMAMYILSLDEAMVP